MFSVTGGRAPRRSSDRGMSRAILAAFAFGGGNVSNDALRIGQRVGAIPFAVCVVGSYSQPASSGSSARRLAEAYAHGLGLYVRARMAAAMFVQS